MSIKKRNLSGIYIFEKFEDEESREPTYEQFTKYGWVNYSNKRPKKHTGLEYYIETLNGTWFSERRKKYPEQFFK